MLPLLLALLSDSVKHRPNGLVIVIGVPLILAILALQLRARSPLPNVR